MQCHHHPQHQQSSSIHWYLIIVHDSVERLDPHWINVPVQYDPLWTVTGQVGHVTHYDGEQAVLPLSGGWVDEAIQLVGCDGLRVNVLPDWLHLHIVIGPVQTTENLREGEERERGERERREREERGRGEREKGGGYNFLVNPLYSDKI